MILFPAIDLKDGVCVRLMKGDMAQATVYNTDPVQQAKSFSEAGFKWLHVVDLNGAVQGYPVNASAVEDILKATDISVQFGGGIRNMKTLEGWLTRGVKRVVLGTIAVENPDFVKQACQAFPGQIVVGLDARGRYVATSGWTKTSDVKLLDIAMKMQDFGVAAIVYTDIDRDGAMSGLNIDSTVDLAFHLSVPVVASGGVSSLWDLQELKREEKAGIEGVIVGRALYDGRIVPAKALDVLRA